MRYFLMVIFLSQLHVFGNEVFKEDFEDPNWLTNTAWEAVSVDQSTTNSYEGEFSSQFSATGDYLITPRFTNLSHLNLQFYPTNSTVGFSIELSSDKSVFTPVTGSPFTGTLASFNLLDFDLPPDTSYIRFKKIGTGSVYMDDLSLNYMSSYLANVTVPTRKLKLGTSDNPIYVIEITNESTVLKELNQLKLVTIGSYRIEDIVIPGFDLYESTDQTLSSEDSLVSMSNRVSSGNELIFDHLTVTIAASTTKFLIVTVSLASSITVVEGDYTLGLTPANEASLTFTVADAFYQDLSDGELFTLWSKANINEEFSDGDFTSNPVWTGDLANFVVKTPPVTGDGSIDDYISNCLATLSSGGSRVLQTQSPAAYGTWQFFVADGMGWSLSSTNKYSVILISDTNDVDKMRYDSEGFNGYFIENDGTFKLCRQDGAIATTLVETTFPADGVNKNSGYTLKVTRLENGEWYIYIRNEEDENPMFSLVGSVIDNNWTECAAFAVRTKINNPLAKRILYLDSLSIIEEIEMATVTAVLDIQFYQETIENETFIHWLTDGSEPVDSFGVWMLKGGKWTLWQSFDGGKESYSYDVTCICADEWLLVVDIEGKYSPLRISCDDGERICCNVFLDEGWNLLGVSDRPEFIDTFKENRSVIFWVWRDGQYQLTETPEANEAFWFYASCPEMCTFNIYKKQSAVPKLELGWNMVSFPAEFPKFESPENLYIYGFDSGNYRECIEGELEPLSGYWVFKTTE